MPPKVIRRNNKGQFLKCGVYTQKICCSCKKKFKIPDYVADRYTCCSRKCGAKHRTGKLFTISQGSVFVDKMCAGCNENFQVRGYQAKRKYCSHQCYLKNIGKKNHPNWRGGKSFEPYPVDFDSNLKLMVRKRDSYECQVCDMSEEENMIVYGEVLSVHHVDYNKNNCAMDNLSSVCHSCHTRTGYNREYWKDFFKKKAEVT